MYVCVFSLLEVYEAGKRSFRNILLTLHFHFLLSRCSLSTRYRRSLGRVSRVSKQFQVLSCDDSLWLSWLNRKDAFNHSQEWISQEIDSHLLQSPRSLFALLRTAGDIRGYWRITGTPHGGLALCETVGLPTVAGGSSNGRGGSSNGRRGDSDQSVLVLDEVELEPSGHSRACTRRRELVRYAVDCAGGGAAVTLPSNYYSAASSTLGPIATMVAGLAGILTRCTYKPKSAPQPGLFLLCPTMVPRSLAKGCLGYD